MINRTTLVINKITLRRGQAFEEVFWDITLDEIIEIHTELFCWVERHQVVPQVQLYFRVFLSTDLGSALLVK